MFEQLRLLGSTERSIALQTHRGWDIPNLIELEPGEREKRIYELLLSRYGKDWVRRKPATGVYNCVGHVWASRRTAVLSELDVQVQQILEDDGYRKMDEGAEKVILGDVVIYREKDRPKQGFLHVGIVQLMREGITTGSAPIPWVLSKWNSTSGEVLHHYMDVPFEKQGIPFLHEFWTDRPHPVPRPTI